MDTLFIADVHLSDARPEKIDLFKQLLRGPARRASAVYILGDLFENFWLGNDDSTSPHPEILSELKNFTGGGPPLYLLRGNRELLLDRGIEPLTGVVMLPDPALIELAGKPVLITHGDLLCTRDTGYQVYRGIMESSPVKWLFPRLPYAIRKLLVTSLRPFFKQSARNKRPEIMDVDPDAVIQTMRRYHVQELIHGHTHRPGVHALNLDNHPARRIVLGDWYENELILVCRNNDRKLLSVMDYLADPG
ncbi:MAG: UDP-2,3-diacylglucosamine hydrolase [Gammaproteobacteria bacterium]|nr:UDP-2,3-diacylglucosamine hydrolase [Gammaproteobacteria bacterium]